MICLLYNDFSCLKAGQELSIVLTPTAMLHFTTTLFLLICTAGFVYQFLQVSQVYFRYVTTSRLEIRINELQGYPSFLFCSRYIDIINRTEHTKYGLNPTLQLDNESVQRDLSVLTMKDIFDITPEAKNAMVSCVTRTKFLDVPEVKAAEECYKEIGVTKAVNGEQICFAFRPKGNRYYSTGSVASSLNYIDIVYDITLSKELSNTLVAILMLFRIKSDDDLFYPLYSRLFSAISSHRETVSQTRFMLYPQYISINRLPPPFDTNCQIGHLTHVCYEDCLTKAMAKVDRVSWSAFIDEPIEMRMMTNLDLKNKKMYDFTNETFAQCHELCKTKTECSTNYTKTEVRETTDTLSNLTRISCMIPSSGNINMNTVPRLTFIEYVVQVGSCVGTWFGLSVFSINPAKWLRKKHSSGKIHTTKSVNSLKKQSEKMVQGPKCPCNLCYRKYLNRYLEEVN